MLAFGNPSGIAYGTGVLKIDGKSVATQTMGNSLPFMLQLGENFDVGAGTGTPVDDQYQVPFEFNGKIVSSLPIDRPQLTPADIGKLKEAQRNNKTSE
jgi:arylsulfatase